MSLGCAESPVRFVSTAACPMWAPSPGWLEARRWPPAAPMAPACGRLVLARDRLGVKPLYLADTGGALRFASTVPALVAGGGVDTGVDPVALHHYLTFHAVVPAPRTLLAGVRKLAPATILVVEPDG